VGRLNISEKSIRKLLYCLFVVAVFSRIFIFSWSQPWATKYLLFNVPAMDYPGADIRNIQVAAHCFREGVPYYGSGSCISNPEFLRTGDPRASAPALNYPALWVKVYGLFKDDSEEFFRKFWTANALLVTAAMVILAFRFNYRSLPLLLFSPVTLLAIERGNIDATTFFFTFIPLLVFSTSAALQSFFIGVASSLKIFPCFAYFAVARRQPPYFSKAIIFGAALAAPLAVASFVEIPHLIHGTQLAFAAAYGISSLKYAPYLNSHLPLAYLVMALFLIGMAVCIWGMTKNPQLSVTVDADLTGVSFIGLTVLGVSCAIYLFTFLTFANYAYRLIFVMPAFLVLCNGRSHLSKLVCGNILFTLWIPFIPHGWTVQNLTCFPLFVLLAFVFLRVMRMRFALAGVHNTEIAQPSGAAG